MKLSKTPHFFLTLVLLFLLPACAPVFENSADVQARQALLDLMRIQETFHSENNKYAPSLARLEKYNLKYHTGIVYLAIESAGPDKYRAVSLPAESTTARVFAYDTDRGGFYEMDEEEVSRYVLGALNYIRAEKRKEDTNILLASILVGVLVILGFRFVWRYRNHENSPALGAYLIALFPLGWSVAALNHMNSDVVFSRQIVTYSAGACLLTLLSLITTSLWLKKRDLPAVPSPLLGLATCTLVISLFNTWVMVHTFTRFYPG